LMSYSRKRWASLEIGNGSTTAVTGEAVVAMLWEFPFCEPSAVSLEYNQVAHCEVMDSGWKSVVS
jgi:hypothetical protein